MGKIHSVPIPDVLYQWINLCVFLITAIKSAPNISCFVWVPRIKMREQQVQSQTNKNLTKDTFPRHDQRNQSWEKRGKCRFGCWCHPQCLPIASPRNDVVKTWPIVTSDAPSGGKVAKTVTVTLRGEHFMRQGCTFDERLAVGQCVVHGLYEDAVLSTWG